MRRSPGARRYPRAGPSGHRSTNRAGRSCPLTSAGTPGRARDGSAGSGSTRDSSRPPPSNSQPPRKCAGRRARDLPARTERPPLRGSRRAPRIRSARRPGVSPRGRTPSLATAVRRARPDRAPTARSLSRHESRARPARSRPGRRTRRGTGTPSTNTRCRSRPAQLVAAVRAGVGEGVQPVLGPGQRHLPGHHRALPGRRRRSRAGRARDPGRSSCPRTTAGQTLGLAAVGSSSSGSNARPAAVIAALRRRAARCRRPPRRHRARRHRADGERNASGCSLREEKADPPTVRRRGQGGRGSGRQPSQPSALHRFLLA
ncbi:hypothetical protein BH24ACT12_BH24ACT12_11260 [soil metagenome]